MLKRIAAAFPAEPIPPKAEILYVGAYPGESELEEIKQFFGDRAWNTITPKDVFRFRHALRFFSPSAFAYFVAAWMTCALADEGAVDTAPEDLVGSLQDADPRLWTPEQQSAICAWLADFDCGGLPNLEARLERAAKNLGCEKWEGPSI